VLAAAALPVLPPPASEPLLLPVPTDKPAPELSVSVTVAALRGVCCAAVVLGAPLLPSVALAVAAAVATFSGEVSTVVAAAAGAELECPAAAAASAAAAAPEDVSILRGTEA
jgi:hypothetical protein